MIVILLWIYATLESVSLLALFYHDADYMFRRSLFLVLGMMGKLVLLLLLYIIKKKRKYLCIFLFLLGLAFLGNEGWSKEIFAYVSLIFRALKSLEPLSHSVSIIEVD